MNLLILTMDYPRPDGTHERMFVHVRDLYYKKQGLDVTVLNFACNYDYKIDGIRVITLSTYKSLNEHFDIVVSHAANLRNHYRFLVSNDKKFDKLVFFFHGHEVLYLNEVYPKPYDYMKKNILRNGIAQDAYDWLKINIWKNYFKRVAEKTQFVFVSHWILSQFKKNTGLSESDLKGHVHIINNSIGAAFETGVWNYAAEKKYDFITIRSIMDGSKYGVDLVVKLAKENPTEKFLLIGRGKYFEYNSKPENIEWIGRTMNHEEMFSYLDASKCGLLLTREDTQGVMTCEFAAYGIPVITSDIEVCHEFFDAMPNVALIDNDDKKVDICKIKNQLWEGVPYRKDTTYFGENTISKEVRMYQSMMEGNSDS